MYYLRNVTLIIKIIQLLWTINFTPVYVIKYFKDITLFHNNILFIYLFTRLQIEVKK